MKNLLLNLFLLMLGFALVAACGRASGSQDSEDSATTRGHDGSVSATSTPGEETPLPTVIDFYATWCGPCKAIAPTFHLLETEYEGRVRFRSVDVDQDPRTASEYAVQAMPTFVFLDRDGKEIQRITGADPAGLQGAVANLAKRH